jgi:dinuclear metal center YbgI/SA1388 family protein
MPSIAAILEVLEEWIPPQGAARGDRVGLLLGDRQVEVRRLMTCLTVTPETAAEAIEAGVQLLLSHHPIFYHPLERLTADTHEGEVVLALARAGVAVYSPHTAFDDCPGGINDLLASRLGLREVRPLRPLPGPASCKVVVFVPESDLNRVADALFAAGAGRIGQYQECSFRVAGTGTFFGTEATHPTLGQKGRREEVAEWRLEVLCPQELVPQVVAALRRAHSYEEPAYDVYPLQALPGTSGRGRLGVLAVPHTVRQLAQTLRESLPAPTVALVGDPERQVTRVALACGAGREFLADACQAGAEVLVTGELRFHDCLAARAAGLAVLLPGHYASERCGVEELARRLAAHWPELEVWASRRETDPCQYLP